MARRFVHPEGAEAFPQNEADENALREIGFVPEGEPAEADESNQPGEVTVKKYRVLSPFQYEGEKYAQGDEVDLPEEEAEKREGKLELLREE